jgi:hypothetical protein
MLNFQPALVVPFLNGGNTAGEMACFAPEQPERYHRAQEIAENRSLVYKIVGKSSGGAIHAFPPPPSELFIVIRRERKAA